MRISVVTFLHGAGLCAEPLGMGQYRPSSIKVKAPLRAALPALTLFSNALARFFAPED